MNTPCESSTRSIQLRSSADWAKGTIRASAGSSFSRNAMTGGRSIEYQVNWSATPARSSRQKLVCSPSASATTDALGCVVRYALAAVSKATARNACDWLGLPNLR
jgi:hypothetical protein